LSGNVIFANFHAARLFAQKINAQRDLARFPEQAVKAGQLNALGLIDEIMHLVSRDYRRERNPQSLSQALSHLEARLGPAKLDETLRRFADEFPPLAVYRREATVDDYLAGETRGIPNRQLLVEELLLLWLANANPACAPFRDLFDDAVLARQTDYRDVIAGLREFFSSQPTFGPENQSLVDMLRSPALAVPHSLPGQLEYILQRWGRMLGRYLYRLLGGLDLIKEEEKPVFPGLGGAGPSLVPSYAALEAEPERFSPDLDWMPRCVMIAKNTYVWLDQLSRTYRREIRRLDQIPDEELERLARWGFTGLWLIGLWERSRASQQIKQMCGNPEAVASAYSLMAYDIAADLGGPDALQTLKDRAWRWGIRLASDMVPNHMGIDSSWVIEHPDWFISLDHSPFPVYSFNGPNLSGNDRVGVYLEDHYYSRSDAAVVFKRVDHWTGDTRYVYHGNDGTNMPWNDTAQLNFLQPEVREAVIQTILHVARQFPIIRFDAAMTLAKRHYQRLWFPEPGTGGAIPTRAEHGLMKSDFNAAIPEEFWREVVDRIQREAPGTLLLAEAFWLMEGYFVRTLGMHRVYNSAFMNMLRNEDNANYRSVFKNTMEFDLEILKRFVNFMNNPDERTAVEQFGKGDKYFGICTLMATLPGLPMFGHGQVEGFSEKYGMEYRRAYWDEHPDEDLIRRHEQEIFPLLHRRHIFAEAENFLLYDFFTPDGTVNEDVFVFSNRRGGERGLVVYHNRYADTRGWIRTSAAFAQKSGADDKVLAQRSLGEGLALRADDGWYTLFRDHLAGLEYIRSNRELHDQGFFVELGAYKSRVYMDFREVADNEWRHYSQLAAYLGGRGVPSIDEAMREIFLLPVHTAFRELSNPGSVQWLVDNRIIVPEGCPDPAVLDEARDKAGRLFEAARHFTGGQGDPPSLAAGLRRELDILLRLPVLVEAAPDALGEPFHRMAGALPLADGRLTSWGPLLGWLVIHSLGRVVGDDGAAGISRSWIAEWLLGRILGDVMQEIGLDPVQAAEVAATVRILTAHQDWFRTLAPPAVPGESVPEGRGQAQGPDRARRAEAGPLLERLLQDPDVQGFLQVNRYRDVLWFNKEMFDRLSAWLLLSATVSILAEAPAAASPVSKPDKAGGVRKKKSEPEPAALWPAPAVERLRSCLEVLETLRRAEEGSGYQVDKLLDLAKL
jgi:glycosidase